MNLFSDVILWILLYILIWTRPMMTHQSQFVYVQVSFNLRSLYAEHYVICQNVGVWYSNTWNLSDLSLIYIYVCVWLCVIVNDLTFQTPVAHLILSEGKRKCFFFLSEGNRKYTVMYNLLFCMICMWQAVLYQYSSTIN